jgi:hypothetical protein
MSWFKVALGLISTAVGTEAGREVISNVRSAIRRDDATAEPPSSERMAAEAIQTMLAQHRAEVDRNLEALVQTLNAQNEKLRSVVRRQQTWNFVLAIGIVIAAIVAFLT